jgi:glucose/arabinose dehydrogenase
MFKSLRRLLCGLILFSTPPGYAAVCDEMKTDGSIPSITLREIAGGLRKPVHLTHAGDGSRRLFVVEQQGTIRIIKNNALDPTPFLDIHDRVSSGGEKGLLSVAFHPKYKNNGLFYVNYTARQNGLQTIIAEFKRTSDNRANPASQRILLKVRQPWGNHNGGQLAFGPDGYLYVGMGDGGAANDPHDNGQRLKTLLGAMLRIDVNKQSSSRSYGIPSDNPFVGQANARDEIWAYGLRNPWRFSFDAANGVLYLADVGQNRFEEIDIIEKGHNYGWNIMEGNICTPDVNRQCDRSGLTSPIFVYPQPEGFSITGGFVYRGTKIPALCGTYIYGDYVTKKIWGLRYDGKKVTNQRQLEKSRYSISSFGQDEVLELYVVDHGGQILKIVAAEN